MVLGVKDKKWPEICFHSTGLISILGIFFLVSISESIGWKFKKRNICIIWEFLKVRE